MDNDGVAATNNDIATLYRFLNQRVPFYTFLNQKAPLPNPFAADVNGDTFITELDRTVMILYRDKIIDRLPYRATKYGDLDLNNVVNWNDYYALFRVVLGWPYTTQYNLSNGDLNVDGNYNLKDLEILRNYLNGAIPEIPCHIPVIALAAGSVKYYSYTGGPIVEEGVVLFGTGKANKIELSADKKTQVKINFYDLAFTRHVERNYTLEPNIKTQLEEIKLSHRLSIPYDRGNPRAPGNDARDDRVITIEATGPGGTTIRKIKILGETSCQELKRELSGDEDIKGCDAEIIYSSYPLN